MYIFSGKFEPNS